MRVLCWFLFWYALLFCKHHDEEERAGCFALIAFLSLVTVNVPLLFLTVPWVGLQCVIVVFPDHTKTQLWLLKMD